MTTITAQELEQLLSRVQRLGLSPDPWLLSYVVTDDDDEFDRAVAHDGWRSGTRRLLAELAEPPSVLIALMPHHEPGTYDPTGTSASVLVPETGLELHYEWAHPFDTPQHVLVGSHVQAELSQALHHVVDRIAEPSRVRARPTEPVRR